MEQRSPEWFATRCGKVTASRVADVIAKTKSGPAASRTNYMAQLIAERLTGTVEPSFTNAAMAWGTDAEPLARAAYEFHAGVLVDEVAFIDHPIVPMSGASPDGLVGAKGLVEIKCPNTATHLETLLGSSLAGKYRAQMQWQMACAGRAWCDFVSFDPRLPPELQLHVERVAWDDGFIKETEAEIRAFIAEMDDKIARLKRLGIKVAA